MIQTDNLGPAVSGFPANMAARLDTHLFVASMGLDPARLVTFDPDTDAVVATAEIPTGLRTWAMTTRGAHVYLGMWGSPAGKPNLYRYDPAARRITAHATVPSRGEFWALAASPEGHTLYAGTRRTGVVSLVDPDSGALGEVAFPAPAGSQVTALVGTHPTLYAGTGRGQAELVAIDRPTGAATSILPRELAGAVGIYDLAVDADVVVATTQGDPAQLAVIDRADPAVHQVLAPGDEAILGTPVVDTHAVFFAGIESGTLYRLDRAGGDVDALATPLPGAPTRRLLRTGAGLLGVAGPGVVWSYDLADGDLATTDLLAAGADGGPERPQSLAVAGDRVAVGTNNAVALHSLGPDGPPGGGRPRRVVVPGEPKTMTGEDGLLYLAVYSNGQVLRLDPDADTPTLVADWPDVQNRPRVIHRHAASHRLLVGTSSDFAGGGALVVIDEAAAEVTVHTDPLAGRQAVESLASLDELALVGGLATDARLAAWDPVAGHKRWETVPVPGGGPLTGLSVADGRIHALTGHGALVTVDPESRRVTARRDLVLGDAGELALADGWLFAVGTRALLRVDPPTLEPTVLVDGLAATGLFTRPLVRRDRAGRLYVFAGLDLLRVTGAAEA